MVWPKSSSTVLRVRRSASVTLVTAKPSSRRAPDISTASFTGLFRRGICWYATWPITRATFLPGLYAWRPETARNAKAMYMPETKRGRVLGRGTARRDDCGCAVGPPVYISIRTNIHPRTAACLSTIASRVVDGGLAAPLSAERTVGRVLADPDTARIRIMVPSCKIRQRPNRISLGRKYSPSRQRLRPR